MIDLKVDNMTTVSAVKKMGSKSQKCDEVAREIWEWAIKSGNWITVSHIPGVEIVCADRESRKAHKQEIEWGLSQECFGEIEGRFKVTPQVDLFATRLNYKVKPFYAWKPDPEADGCDVFTKFWGGKTFYTFPPFALLPKVIQKVKCDRAVGVIIAPVWKAQPWYPVLLECLLSDVVLLPSTDEILWHPTLSESERHSMGERLVLATYYVSGNLQGECPSRLE